MLNWVGTSVELPIEPGSAAVDETLSSLSGSAGGVWVKFTWRGSALDLNAEKAMGALENYSYCRT